MIYTVNCIRFGYKLIDKETLMGTQTTYDILRKLKINMSFLKFLTCREFAASVNRWHHKLNKTESSTKYFRLLSELKSRFFLVRRGVRRQFESVRKESRYYPIHTTSK